MIDDKSPLPEDFENPNWQENPHDWKQYIGERTRLLWRTIPYYPKAAIARDAQDKLKGESQ